MAQGKFSRPRDNRGKDPEIERAFREATGQAEVSEPQSTDYQDVFPEGFEPIPALDPLTFDEGSEPDDQETSFVDTVLNFISKNKKVVLVCLCAVALALIIGIISLLLFGSADPYDGKILHNVLIADVNVGGMTREEAESAVKRATDRTYGTQDMVVDLAGTTLLLSPADTGAALDVEAAVDAAFDYGRTGTQEERDKAYEASLTGNHTIGLLPYLTLNEDYIQGVLAQYAQDIGSTLTQASYEMEGEMPSLEFDKFNELAPCQTLVLTMGTPGVSFDAASVYDQILDAYSLHRFLVEVDDVSPVADPDPVDLEAIYQAVSVAPVDAAVDMQTYETIPGSYGYGFDMEKAKMLVAMADYGEVVRIPMEYIAPEIMEDEVFFRDVLGSCETPHSNNANRTANLELACAALNGLVLKPGEEFSYNAALGERTAARGYKAAPAYSGYELVDSIGGGICQGSSTIYYCALLADLEILERVNHGYPVSYITIGMDATVSWNGPDFRFKNNTNFPIRIEAEVSDGYVRMKILGTDERDYYVKMEYESSTKYRDVKYVEYGPDSGYRDGEVLEGGTDGYYVKSYKCKYDKKTDALISRDFEARSSYTSDDKIVVKIVGGDPEETVPPETTAPSETVPPESTTPPETTPPETTAPPETTPPETTAPPETSPPATTAPPATEAPAPSENSEAEGSE